MRPTHLFAHAALVSALVIGCGPAEGSCAIDTDCVLGQRCSSENLCVPLGGGDLDGGARDAGDSRDATVADARTDAPAPVDGGSDAGAPSCDSLAGTYVVGELTATCGTIAAGQSMVATNTGADTGCTLMLASAELDAMVLDGSVTLDESAEFIGTMLSVAGDPMNACTGRFTLAGLAVSCTNTVSSETCMLGFTRP